MWKVQDQLAPCFPSLWFWIPQSTPGHFGMGRPVLSHKKKNDHKSIYRFTDFLLFLLWTDSWQFLHMPILTIHSGHKSLVSSSQLPTFCVWPPFAHWVQGLWPLTSYMSYQAQMKSPYHGFVKMQHEWIAKNGTEISCTLGPQMIKSPKTGSFFRSFRLNQRLKYAGKK